MNPESKYRRKLQDLVSKVEAFIDEMPAVEFAQLMNDNKAFMPLVEEAMLVKDQIAIEEQYNAQMPSHGVMP